MGIFDGYRRAIEELRHDDEHRPAPRSVSPTQRGTSLFRSTTHEDYERHEPPKDEMQEYWRAYETTPFLRQSISSFSREVVEPGWYIETENEQAAEDVAEWFRNCAIVERKHGKDFTLLARKAIIQREVRGTALIEHVPDVEDSEKLAGLKLINPETVTIFTNDETSMLVRPDDDPVPDDVPETEEGEPAAYVQYYRNESGQEESVAFTADQITQIVRDADIGEVFGTSRLETVLERIESLRQKQHDLDQAVNQKAWPTWIFQFGSEDDPWHPDDIDAFMRAEDEDNFTPGTKHGVQGDISVETVGGDVPDITNLIREDINYILSIMPMPKFATGYADDVNQHTAQQLDRHIARQVREARRELEYEIQDVVDIVAEQTGHGDVDDIKLRLELPPEEEDPEMWEERGTTIRYVSNVDQEDEDEDGGDGDGGDDGSDNGGSDDGGGSDEDDAE